MQLSQSFGPNPADPRAPGEASPAVAGSEFENLTAPLAARLLEPPPAEVVVLPRGKDILAQFGAALCADYEKRWGPRWQMEGTFTHEELFQEARARLNPLSHVELYRAISEYKSGGERNANELHCTFGMSAEIELRERLGETVKHAWEELGAWQVRRHLAAYVCDMVFGLQRFLGAPKPGFLSLGWAREKLAVAGIHASIQAKFMFKDRDTFIEFVKKTAAEGGDGLGRFQGSLIEALERP